ncbi:MAG TPA: CHASE domain-containing protein, partial [Opitutus sp.]|nr:CHASE domain-containing protein [Opitutus sp.]
MPSTRSARFPRSLAVLIAAIGCIGAAFSFAVYRYSLRAQRSHLEAEFVRRAEIRHALSRELLNHYVSAVYALKGLFQGSARVSREEFRTVASEIIGRYPGITALEWVPIVPAGERAALEAAVSAELGRAWQFTERGATPDAPL